jgi:hypothetical protein
MANMKHATGTAQAVAVVAAVLVALAVFRSPPKAEKTVVTKTTVQADGKKVIETTEKPVDRSAFELTLDSGDDLLFKLLAVALAMFGTGAVVQRVAMGRFGFKAFGAELPDITDAVTSSDKTIAELSAALEEQRKLVADVGQTAASALRLAAEALARDPAR